MAGKTKLTLEGVVPTASGRLLVVDPGYLVKLDLSDLERFEEQYQERWLELLVEEAETKISSRKDRAKRVKEILKRKNKMKREPTLQPPYLWQERNYIAFRNGFGDIDTPIIRTDQRVHIIIDGRTNYGTNLGSSSIDTGMQIIIDPSRVNIRKDFRPELYVEFEAQNGDYSCRFIRQNGALSIKRS